MAGEKDPSPAASLSQAQQGAPGDGADDAVRLQLPPPLIPQDAAEGGRAEVSVRPPGAHPEAPAYEQELGRPDAFARLTPQDTASPAPLPALWAGFGAGGAAAPSAREA